MVENTPGSTRRTFNIGVVSLLLAPVAARAMGASAVPASATISAVTPTAWDRTLFGQFLEHFDRQVYGGVFDPGSPLADRAGFRLDVVEALRELKVPIVRWPGGCFVSAYHWRDGVGKVREPSFNKAWGVIDPNTFGTDEFVAWCRLIGAEPYICTNAGTGTEDEMSEWVEYTNLKGDSRVTRLRPAGHKEPFNVRYWSIGNENYFGTEIGSKTIAEWGPLVWNAARMMRAVDSDIVLFAAANTDNDWTVPLLKSAGDMLNYISIHGYWDHLWEDGTTPLDYRHAVARSRQPEEQIERAVKLINDNGFKGRIKIAFDEWNLRSWHHPGFPGGGANRTDLIAKRIENDRNEVYTMADALFSASFLNGCMRHADVVSVACMAPVVNVRGPLFVHPKGVVRRTTFHVLKMYSDLLQPLVAGCTMQSSTMTVDDMSLPQIDVLPTVSADRRKWAVAIVNRDPVQAASVKLTGLPIRSGMLTILDGDSPDAYNDIAHPNRVVPRRQSVTLTDGTVQVPPHSLSILTADA